MTKTEYRAYITGPEWQARRREVLADVPQCERCQIPRWLAELLYDQDLHVHHKSYSNLGDEAREDLEVLCRRCHDVETFGRSELMVPKVAHCDICRAKHYDYRSATCAMCKGILEGSAFSNSLVASARGQHELIPDVWHRALCDIGHCAGEENCPPIGAVLIGVCGYYIDSVFGIFDEAIPEHKNVVDALIPIMNILDAYKKRGRG